MKKVQEEGDKRAFDVWLAIDQHFLPARIRATEKDGTVFDSMVESVNLVAVTELTRGRLDAAVSALQVVLGLTRPADAALRLFFRDHPSWASTTAAFVAELVFTVLRHLRLLEHLAGDPQPRRLALAALSLQLGFSVRELTPNAGARR